MRKAFIFFIGLCTTLSAAAQLKTMTTCTLTAYGSGDNIRLIDIPPVPQHPIYSYYLNYSQDHGWAKGSILLGNNRIIRECTLRYDIANAYIEFESESGIRATHEAQVRQFCMMEGASSRWFISGLYFEDEEDTFSTLMEVLVNEPTQLLLRTRIIISYPYQPSRMYSAKLEVKYYLAQGNQLIDISTKKKMFAAFGERQAEMKSWAKNVKFKYKNQIDLIYLVKHYNRLSYL